MRNDPTDIQKWTIQPTPLERAMGRLMRGPDGHDADGDPGADAGGDASGDAGGDGGSDAAGSGDAGDGGNADDPSLLAAATAGDGAGDAGGDKDADGKDGADDKPADAIVPEAYDLSITIKDAEGKDQKVDIDPVLLTEATPILKDLKLTNEQANQVAALVPKVQQRLVEQQSDEFAKTKADWAKQTQNDPEIGGKNWKETQTLAARALDRFAGGAEKNEDGTFKSGFRQLLEDTGLTNHPDMARALREIGKGLAEDGSFPRGDGKIQKKSREEELYPDDVPTKK
jgi:hypothetical protein